MTRWGKTALHNAILSDNDLDIVQVLLDRGADPALIASRPDRSACASPGQTAVAMAARRGRGALLAAFERRGSALTCAVSIACSPRVQETTPRPFVPSRHQSLMSWTSCARTAAGSLPGSPAWTTSQACATSSISAWTPARCSRTKDAYFDVAKNSLALHVAAWRASHATVRRLIERGSPVDAPDGQWRTPLALAVRACVDSYWTYRRTPESVQALLDAGASARDVAFPPGYAEVDELLRKSSS